MKKLFTAVIASIISLSVVGVATLVTPSKVEAAGVTYTDLKVSYSKIISGTTFVLASGSDVVSVSQYGWVTGLKPGNATIYAYDANGIHTWTFHFTVTR
ncbi:hypothetical protein D3C77_704630 [compost metagenome]